MFTFNLAEYGQQVVAQLVSGQTVLFFALIALAGIAGLVRVKTGSRVDGILILLAGLAIFYFKVL